MTTKTGPQKLYTIKDLFILAEEYHTSHPEQDVREGVIWAESPADSYYLGVVDFLQWLANGKQFLYEPETYEDIDDEEFQWMANVLANAYRPPLGVLNPLIEGPLDQEEEDNLDRDETY